MTDPTKWRSCYDGAGVAQVQNELENILVLWSGYSIDDASWIPATNFDYPEVLEEMVTRDQPVEDPR